MWLKTLFKLFVITLLSLVLAGCAQTMVTDTAETANSRLARPERILIYNFAVTPQDVELNSSIFAHLQRNIGHADQTEDEIQTGHEVADALANELSQKIAEMGLNPVRADQSMPVAPRSILITGQFVKIDEGNRLRRNVIGLGFGQSSIDSNVSVLAPMASGYEQLIAFDAHADSGEMPGAAEMGPAGAAAGAGAAAIVATNIVTGGIKSYKSASVQQAKKIADKIASQLADYFAQQGWINPAP